MSASRRMLEALREAHSAGCAINNFQAMPVEAGEIEATMRLLNLLFSRVFIRRTWK